MKSIQSLIKLTDEEVNELKQNYIKKLDDRNFRELIKMLNTSDEVLMKYTSSLEDASVEFSHCQNCKGLEECKNKIKGYMYTPKLDNNRINFSFIACSYQVQKEISTKYQENIDLLEGPKRGKEALLKESRVYEIC